MNSSVQETNERIALSVSASNTGEHVISSTRLTTGELYYVSAVKTAASEYVIRMTNDSRKDKIDVVDDDFKLYFTKSITGG